MVSNTLGTALGDFTATTTGLGFETGALIFMGLLALVAAAYFWTRIPRAILSAAERPDFAGRRDTRDSLTSPHVQGGLRPRLIGSTARDGIGRAGSLLPTSRAVGGKGPARLRLDLAAASGGMGAALRKRQF